MKIRVYSDLHLESGPFKPQSRQADVIVLAGDIHHGISGVIWAKKHFPHCPVVYVPGNHEYYYFYCPNLIDDLKQEAQRSQVHVLENDSVQIGGYVFLGCTLWTDFRLAHDATTAMVNADREMSDFRLIQKWSGNGRFCAQDSAQMHATSVRWLKHELARHEPAQTIVVTHHAPSPRSIAPWNSGDLLNAAFASDLEKLVQTSRIPLWIHGHTHYNVDYEIGQTRVFSNQRGYSAERLECFQPGHLIELS